MTHEHPEAAEYAAAAPELIAVAVGLAPRQVIKCPLCAWEHEMPPIKATADTLAGVFGHGVMMMAAFNERAHATERALNAHLSTHTLVEWVQKVSRLEHELAVLRSAIL